MVAVAKLERLPMIWRMNEAARRLIWQAVDYEPGPEQLAIHLDPARLKCVAGGERAGKSRLSAEELLCWLMVSDGLFWIVGPDYELARPEFLHLIDAALRCGLVQEKAISLPTEGSCRLRTKLGAQVMTRTSQDVQKLAGRAPDGILMVEAAQQEYEAFLRCRGRVAETRGPLLLSGTFEGSMGWYADLWRAWQGPNVDEGRSFSLPTWSNEAIYPGGREDPEIKALEATFPPDLFMERFGAVPCPPATLVFKEFRHDVHVRLMRFADVPVVRESKSGVFLLPKKAPIQVWIDPGYAGAYACSFVVIDHGKVYNFDEIYVVGQTAQEVIAEAKRRPWWGRV